MSVETATPVQAPAPAARSGAGAARGWLVHPWFDLLLIANVGWPILLLVQFSDGFTGRAGLEFWQIYYVTTPHRWITLALVFLDRERFGERRGLFLGIALLVAAICVGVRVSTGALTCLLTIDYLWNAWHFAAQHHGIYRIYDRMGTAIGGREAFAEKWLLRTFLLYVILRVVTATWAEPAVEDWLSPIDWFVLVIPAWLLFRAIARRGDASWGALAYLVSMLVLYVSLLWAAHLRNPGLVLALALASALFHAIEYLALVTWSVERRYADRGDRMGFLGWLASRWGAALGIFILILGVGGWLMNDAFFETWLLINVVVAFLHYAYDGLIWRRGAKAEAAA
jgi:hypothetical protein